MTNGVFQKVKNYILENQMIAPGDFILAGISGGADSIAMLDLLRRMEPELKFQLWAIHVNHGIRGAEALRDQKIVEKQCLEWKIPYRACVYDVPMLAQQWKMGAEETGRMVRREAFTELSKELKDKFGAVSIKSALAHNQNDLAETMLHHLARGTGIRGLASMRPKTDSIIRPVLCLKRTEIERYLEEQDIGFATDSTNLEDDYTRNRIRHHILPLMEQEVNSCTVAHLAEVSGILAKTQDYLEKQGKTLLDKYQADNGCVFFPNAFFAEEPILQDYAVMEALGHLAGKRKDLTALHVRQVLDLYKNQTGRRILLPYHLTAKREYEGVRLLKRAENFASADEEKSGIPKMEEKGMQKEWNLSVPGKLDCELGSFETEIFCYQGEKFSEKKYTKWFDYDKIERSLFVRTRRSGDVLVVDREGHHKKITRCMIDEKIPKECRDSLPLLVSGADVLWMVGGRISEMYKITTETRQVLVVKYKGGQQE